MRQLLVCFAFVGAAFALNAESNKPTGQDPSIAKASSDRQDRPNIIVIMADDLGAEGLACYGSSIYTTPNLDTMAQEGVLFNNAYSTPLCTPTRVMIMTGKYPNRSGFTSLISGKEKDARMPAMLKTFGNYFKEAGYKTAMAGKWQLGQFDFYPNQPVEHGFNAYCMWKWMFGGKKTSRFYEPGIWSNGESKDGGVKDYGPDIYTQFVVDFIEQNQGEPFFIYFPMALVHSPFRNPPGLKELSHSKYVEGMNKETMAFGHMITYMDMLVGKILQKLKDTGLDDNTLVMFTGDNGTSRKIISQLGGLKLEGAKGSMTEAGTRVPFICRWPSRVPAGRELDEMFCLVDVLPTISKVAGVEIASEGIDGMDLSHYLFGTEGVDRDHVFMSYNGESFVRDQRFRLSDEGVLFDIPATSNESRYSEKISINPEHKEVKERLQVLLDQYNSIEPEASAAFAKFNPHAGKKDKKKEK